MEEYRLGELRHLLTTVFLSGFSEFLVKPVMTDVTVAAVCSGLNETCSLAVYLTGVEQVVSTSTYICIYVLFTVFFLLFDVSFFWVNVSSNPLVITDSPKTLQCFQISNRELKSLYIKLK